MRGKRMKSKKVLILDSSVKEGPPKERKIEKEINPSLLILIVPQGTFSFQSLR